MTKDLCSGFSHDHLTLLFGLRVRRIRASLDDVITLISSNEMNTKVIINIVVLAAAFVCASSHELRGGPNVCLMSKPSHNRASSSLSFFLDTHTHALLFIHLYLFLSIESWWCWAAVILGCYPQVLSDVAPTDANRESHDQMTTFVGLFEVCDTFAMKLSNCLFSKGESFNEAIQCFDCIHNAYDTYLQGDFKCAELKEAGFCDATDLCKGQVCDNLCSTEIDNWLSCHIVWKGCDDEDKNYW